MNLRKAEKNDWEILYDWRNDELTRINSVNTFPITIEEHKKWFFNSLNNNSRAIYIVEENEKPIGTVRKDYIDNKIFISWTIAPTERGKGHAKRMVKMFVEMLNGELYAYIKENNIASVKVAENVGFKKVEIDKGLLVYKLERKNEDR